jgi:hypothetical protein
MTIRQGQIKGTDSQFRAVVMVNRQGFEEGDNIRGGYLPGLRYRFAFNEDNQGIAAGIGMNTAFQFKSYLAYMSIF